MTISCNKVTGSNGNYKACNSTSFEFCSFRKTRNSFVLILTCGNKHRSNYQLDSIADNDKPYIHGILKDSPSKFAVCNLTTDNSCESDEEKIACVNKSFDKYKNK